MNISSWTGPLVAHLPVSKGDELARLVVANLPYLEKQCRRAVSQDDCRAPARRPLPAFHRMPRSLRAKM